MKRVAIFGSTGSVGAQALEIVAAHGDKLSVRTLTCGVNVALLRRQMEVFRPAVVCVGREADALILQRDFPHVEVAWGDRGLTEVAGLGGFDIMLNALVGIAGLAPTLAAIESAAVSGETFVLALANKETLVTGGPLVMEGAAVAGVDILPVDSEHSAIFQCLQGNEGNPVRKIVLTASGGPFRGYDEARLRAVTVAEALAHPNWRMGEKITVDSATMMNKGFEIIEAKWLFGLMGEQITVAIHPESIVHSMVEYEDGALMAQLGLPSMKVPISYAFSYPERWDTGTGSPDLFQLEKLCFAPPEGEARRCINLAHAVLRAQEQDGLDSPAIALNGANEVLVRAFLDGKIDFLQINRGLERVLERHRPRKTENVAEILAVDEEARESAVALAGGQR